MTTGFRRAAFLDRDGVINVDRAYVHRWEDFEFIPGALDAIARLSAAGYRIVVVTNQSGIARGFYTSQDFDALTRRMLEAFEANGIVGASVFHCPHHPAGRIEAFAIECDCRKPAPGMILSAAARHDLSLADSFLVGDKCSDIEAARRAGVGRAFLVGDEPAPSAGEACPDARFSSLADCVDHLIPSGATR